MHNSGYTGSISMHHNLICCVRTLIQQCAVVTSHCKSVQQLLEIETLSSRCIQQHHHHLIARQLHENIYETNNNERHLLKKLIYYICISLYILFTRVFLSLSFDNIMSPRYFWYSISFLSASFSRRFSELVHFREWVFTAVYIAARCSFYFPKIGFQFTVGRPTNPKEA